MLIIPSNLFNYRCCCRYFLLLRFLMTILIIHCIHLATRCNFCLLALTPEHAVKATNQQDSPDDTVTRTTKEEDPQAHELIHRDQYASNFTHCPLKLLIINYLNNLDSYLPRWTISPRKNEEQNTVKTKQSRVQTAKKTGPFSSTHHACR